MKPNTTRITKPVHGSPVALFPASQGNYGMSLTRRGIVFKEQDGSISLIRLDAEMVVHGMTIGDEHEFYTNLPECDADVVDVDDTGDEMGLVAITSVQQLTFKRGGVEVPARQAIQATLEIAPEEILKLLS